MKKNLFDQAYDDSLSAYLPQEKYSTKNGRVCLSSGIIYTTSITKMIRKIIVEIISFLLVVLLTYAALTKLADYQKFAVQISQSPLLTAFAGIVPWLVIAAELGVVGLLAFPRFRLAGFFGAFMLMTMFTAYIFIILHYSSFIPCSCGGVLEKLGWREHLVFNAGFVILSLIAIILQAQLQSKEREQHKT